MSHRDDCPTDSEARREGERAFERGLGSWRNPYKADWPDEGCPEAAENWQRGFRTANCREEERQAEEAYHRRIQREEAEQRELEEFYAQQEYEAPPPEPQEQEPPR